MRLPTKMASANRMRRRFLVILIATGALLLLLAGSLTIGILARYASNASASSVAGVYVGAGDGTLYKLDGDLGKTVWHVQVSDRQLPASPVLINGVVYFGTLSGSVYAVNAGTGQQLWHFQTGGGVLVSPAVQDNVVYVGSTDNFIYALNAQTGARLWRFDTSVGNESVAPGGVAVANGVVYGTASDQTDHSYLFALDAKTGAQDWRVKVHNQLFSEVQVVSGVVYFNSSPLSQAGGPQKIGSVVYAYDAKTGVQLWVSAKLGTLTLSAPLVSNGTVYVGSQDASVSALNAQTGALLWRRALGGPVNATPVIANETLFVGVAAAASTSVAANNKTSDATPTGSDIVALDARTGNLIWQETKISHYNGTPLALYGNRVYLGTGDNGVYALDTATGAVVWQDQLASANPFNNAPITAGL